MIDITYKKKVNRIMNLDSYHYLSINPIKGLKSLEQFKFIIKKCIREISKKYNVTNSYDYLKYVSVIEINTSITKGYPLYLEKFPKLKEVRPKQFILEEPINDIDEMGYHTHIFFENEINGKRVDSTILKSLITNEFRKEGISIDYFGKDVIRTPKKFINYHTKQFSYLDEGFVLSNLTRKPRG